MGKPDGTDGSSELLSIPAQTAPPEPAPLPPRVPPGLAPLTARSGAHAPKLRWTRIAVDIAALSLAVTAGGVAAGTPAGFAGAGAVALATLALLCVRGSYDALALRGHVGFLDEVRETAGAACLAAMATITCAALAAPGTEATAGAARAWLAGSLLIAAGRGAVRAATARFGRPPAQPVLIVGAGRVGVRLEQRLRDLPELGLDPIGFIDSAPMELPARSAPVIAPLGKLAEAIEATGVKHVLLAFSSGSDRALLGVIATCRRMGAEAWAVPRLFDSVGMRAATDHVGGMPVTRLRAPLPPRALRMKDLADRLAAVGAILVLAPLLLGIAIAVRASSPGPVLFRQRRIGRDGVAFEMLKFRSMRLATAQPSHSASGGQLSLDDPTGPGGVEGGDRRTRVGALLRATSLDELPQLLNIARGEMSFVGPRPERREFMELFADSVERYTDRHRMKAGLTGWAQVHGLRGQTSLAKRIEWDNWYIDNWSPWLDLKILLMTATSLRRGAG